MSLCRYIYCIVHQSYSLIAVYEFESYFSGVRGVQDLLTIKNTFRNKWSSFSTAVSTDEVILGPGHEYHFLSLAVLACLIYLDILVSVPFYKLPVHHSHIFFSRRQNVLFCWIWSFIPGSQVHTTAYWDEKRASMLASLLHHMTRSLPFIDDSSFHNFNHIIIKVMALCSNTNSVWLL